MKKILNTIGYDSKLDVKIKFTYIITGLSILLVLLFSIFYVLVVQSLLVNFVTVLCFLDLCLAFFLLKKKHYYAARLIMIFGFLFQEFSLVFLWFPQAANFNYFFFVIAPISFFVFDFSIKIDKVIIISINLIATLLLFLSEMLVLTPYIELSDNMLSVFTSMSVLSTVASITVVYYLYANNLTHTHNELKLLANTDSLTNISNRRVLFKQGGELFEICKKYNRTFTLVLFDIDHFKKVNDTYGHFAGDDVLKQLTFILSCNIRKYDIFARYGGEEFAIILKDTTLTDNTIVASLTETIGQHLFKVDDDTFLNITVSGGVVTFDKDFSTFEEMVLVADKALYQAKENGRNQIVRFQ